MNGTITKFFGQAMTGQGMKNVYKELMNEARQVYFLKGAHGFKLSECLREIGYLYIHKGFDVEFFYDPLFENSVEATFVKGKNLLFLQATNPSIEPTHLGTRHKVISLYDCLDEEKLSVNGERLAKVLAESEKWRTKTFESIELALKIHDDWEVENRKHMDWRGLEEQSNQLIHDVFSAMNLNKIGQKTHRLLGTLTPGGARDTLQSITKNLDRRLFIKGYPGTGKSSMMKKFAQEAFTRGFDVQMVWCGLDARSIDMVILPELKFCIFDSTEPHVYFPEESRKGDEIFDMAKHCHPTEVEEKNVEEIVARYRDSMNKAITFAGRYAEAVKESREIIDSAINFSEWKNRTSGLLKVLE